MAKVQGLPLNPSKISGVCGRLLCCLAYEKYEAPAKSIIPVFDTEEAIDTAILEDEAETDVNWGEE